MPKKLKVNLGNEKVDDDIPTPKETPSTPPAKRTFSSISNPKKLRSSYIYPEVEEAKTPDVEKEPNFMNEDAELEAMMNSLGMDDDDLDEGRSSRYDYGDDDDDNLDMDLPPMQSDEEVKKELLRRLYYMQSQGEKIPRKCTMNMTRDDIEQVYGNVMHARKARTSIKFYKQIYYFLTWAIEKAALKFGKGKIRLKDWSEGVAANLESYDPIFEEIYYTHEDVLGGLDPLIKLGVLTIASAAVFHINAPEEQTDNDVINSLLDRIERDPQLASMFMERFVQHYHPQQAGPPEYINQPPPRQATPRMPTPRAPTPATPRAATPTPVPVAPAPADLPIPFFEGVTDEPLPTDIPIYTSEPAEKTITMDASTWNTSTTSTPKKRKSTPRKKKQVDAEPSDDIVEL